MKDQKSVRDTSLRETLSAPLGKGHGRSQKINVALEKEAMGTIPTFVHCEEAFASPVAATAEFDPKAAVRRENGFWEFIATKPTWRKTTCFLGYVTGNSAAFLPSARTSPLLSLDRTQPCLTLHYKSRRRCHAPSKWFADCTTQQLNHRH